MRTSRMGAGTHLPLKKNLVIGSVLLLSILIGQIPPKQAGARSMVFPESECIVVEGVNDRCEDWIASLDFSVYDGVLSDPYVFGASKQMYAAAEQVVVSVPVAESESSISDARHDIRTYALDANGSQLWSQTFAGAADKWDIPFSVAMDRDDGTVYVTGMENYPSSPQSIGGGPCGRPLYESASAVTLAYDAGSGTQLWVSNQSNAGTSLDAAFAVAVSPGGQIVYTAGVIEGLAGAEYPTCDLDFAVAALDSATGREIWMARMDGTAADGSFDRALSIAVSPDGEQVFAAGVGTFLATGRDFLTVGLNAATHENGGPDPGEVLWMANYDGGRGEARDEATGLALSPDGSMAFVTGRSHEGRSTRRYEDTAFETLAYDTATGQRRWASRYIGGSPGVHEPSGIAVDPSGAGVFVTGISSEVNEFVWDYATVAYSAGDGEELWVRTYHPAYDVEVGRDVVTSPSGDRVYVTGLSSLGGLASESATVAYAKDGEELWAARSSDGSTLGAGGRALSYEVAINGDGSRLFVLGVAQTAAVENADSPETFPYPRHWPWKVWSYSTGSQATDL